MGFDQYHEPADELSQETRTFARMITSLIEEAEAIGWYEQRMSLEKDKEAKAIMANAQKEEFKHFGMNLEFLLRRNKMPAAYRFAADCERDPAGSLRAFIAGPSRSRRATAAR